MIRSGKEKWVRVVRRVGWNILIFPAVCIAYFPALDGDFIWDDRQYVTENPLLGDKEGLWRIWFDFDASRQYYPMANTAFWILHRFWGLETIGYHLANVFLHGLNACLLGAVLGRIGFAFPWLAAWVFALHPVHVESVAWIMELKNVLSGTFFLLAAWVYLGFLNSAIFDSGAGTGKGWTEDPAARVPGSGFRRDDDQKALEPPVCVPPSPPFQWRLYSLSFLLYVCALLTKTVTCVFPAVTLIVIWWKRGRLGLRDVLLLLPHITLGFGMGIITVWSEINLVGASGEEFSMSFLERALVAGGALWFYAGKVVWPEPLMFIYPMWEIDSARMASYHGIVGFLFVLVGLWFLRESLGRGPLAAILSYTVMLFPAVGFFNVYPMRYSYVSDRYQYLASIGIIALLAWGVGRLLTGWWPWNPRLARMAAGLWVLILALTAWNQSHIFQNEMTIWTDTVRQNPRAWVAHNNLGNLYLSKGRYEPASEAFREAYRLKPTSAVIANNLGYSLYLDWKTEEAIEVLNQAVESDRGHAKAYLNLGNAYSRIGTEERARICWRRALELAESSGEDQVAEAARKRLGRPGF